MILYLILLFIFVLSSIACAVYVFFVIKSLNTSLPDFDKDDVDYGN